MSPLLTPLFFPGPALAPTGLGPNLRGRSPGALWSRCVPAGRACAFLPWLPPSTLDPRVLTRCCELGSFPVINRDPSAPPSIRPLIMGACPSSDNQSACLLLSQPEAGRPVAIRLSDSRAESTHRTGFSTTACRRS